MSADWSSPEPTAARRALRRIADARRALDLTEAWLVRRARLEGATWSELGLDLGVTKEAVRRRHRDRDPLRPIAPPGGPEAPWSRLVERPGGRRG